MSHLLRLSACAALVAGLFAGAWAVKPAALRDLGLDVWEWPTWQDRIAAQDDRLKDLERRWQVSTWRDQMKRAICRELVGGRLTLREAARRFTELPDPPERLWEDLRRNFPEGTDEERMVQHVLSWASDQPALGGAWAGERLRRLQEELRARPG